MKLTMSMKEAIELKKQLEKDVTSMILQFNRETGLSVSDIDLITHHSGKLLRRLSQRPCKRASRAF